jgi:peroxiredoxin
MEAPALRTFYQRTHKPDAGYEVLAISLDETREAAQEAASELKMPFPVLLDSAQKVAQEYLVEAIPALMVIDKTGRVRYSSVGFDMTMGIMLAQQLGIKDYTPVTGANP